MPLTPDEHRDRAESYLATAAEVPTAPVNKATVKALVGVGHALLAGLDPVPAETERAAVITADVDSDGNVTGPLPHPQCAWHVLTDGSLIYGAVKDGVGTILAVAAVSPTDHGGTAEAQSAINQLARLINGTAQ